MSGGPDPWSDAVRTPTRFAAFALAACALVACGDDHDDHAADDPIAEACEHAADGPSRAVTAAAPEAAPAIQSYAHARVDITLLAETDGNGGSVAFNVAEAGDYIFFLTADVPLAFGDDAGGIAIEATAAVDACAEVAVSHTVELDPGIVTLTFGPTEATEVGLIFEAGGDHDHE